MGTSTISMAIFNSYVKLPEGKYFIPVPQYLGTWPMPCLVHLSNSLAAMTQTEATRMRASNGLVDPYWSIKIPLSSIWVCLKIGYIPNEIAI